MFHTWFVLGFPIFCAVEGASMATTLLGNHIDMTCPACNFTFSVAAGEEDTLTVCPNCATKFTPPSTTHVLDGDRVLIDRTAFMFRKPVRWEVVAAQRLGQSATQKLVVKRVLGLPGERVRFIDGDLYINGRIQRKALRQQRAMRILVHDDDFAGPAPRWRPQDIGSNWTRQNGRLVHLVNPGDDIGWIVYNHARPGKDGESVPARVTDYSFYNRGRLQRNEGLHYMADMAMSFRVEEIRGRGRLSLQATDGRDEIMVQIDPGGDKFIVLKNRKPLSGPWGEIKGSVRGQMIEVSLFDRQFLFALGGRTLVTVDLDDPRPPPLTDQPLAIGAEGLEVALDRLRVYRDIYYAEPLFSRSPGGAAEVELKPNEYFVVGDNSPVSEDSRTWSENRFFTPDSLLGKPLLVIDPACEVSLGGRRMQVPDLSRIRYIR